MDSVDNDERLEYVGVADPFMDIDCNPDEQTGSDWYALALAASLGGKVVHGHTFATTTETLGKTTFEFAARHTVGWIRTNESVMMVDQPGDDWDEVVRPTRLHTGVVTGSQLSLMFDTDSWEPSGATRARNTAFLAAGMVTNGVSVQNAQKIAGAISGEEVPEAAIMNTVVPVSHLKREAAGVAKSSHAIFSRMNAQRYIAWQDQQLHQGVLPNNASLDWAKVTVVARYLAEANIRYDKIFRKVASQAGVPYVIVKGSWAYVGREDYTLVPADWENIPKPSSALVRDGSLRDAYSQHTARLTTQIMRTYNELASDKVDHSVESLLMLAENLRSRRSVREVRITPATETLASTSSHQQSAAIAAEVTATSATSHNALVQAFGEFALADRALVAKASYIVAANKRYDDLLADLTPFMTILASHHTWMRAFEILNHLIQNPRTSLDRMNRLHRSVTQSSQTIEVDTPLTSRARSSLGPHTVGLLKKALIRPGPTVALPRYITNFKQSVERGEHAQLLRSIGDHLVEYREKWADRYEDWARVFALSKVNTEKSVLYGAASRAFRMLKPANIMSKGSQFCDGANMKDSYLHKIATDYARKRRLAKPSLPIKPIGGALEYAEILDKQYNAPTSFKTVVEFVTPKLEMFANDLALGIEPEPPVEDHPEDTELSPSKTQEEIDLEAMLEELMGDDEDAFAITEDRVEGTYPADINPNEVARLHGYENFSAAYAALGEKARWDTESDWSREVMGKLGKKEEEEDGTLMI
jgi:hypothetical protein